MGAGKTTLVEGYRSNQLGFSVYDLDHEIASELKLAPRTLGEWINEEGMPAFRLKEKEVLQKILQKEQSKIIALGGGTVGEAWFWDLKGKAPLIFLKTPFETCFERIKDDVNRPMTLLKEEGLRQLYQKRLADYEKADFRCEAYEIKGIDALLSLVHTLKDY